MQMSFKIGIGTDNSNLVTHCFNHPRSHFESQMMVELAEQTTNLKQIARTEYV